MKALTLLTAFPPLIAAGMCFTVLGRLGLVRLADGRYRGSFLSWAGFIGGTVLAVLALFGLLAAVVWMVIQ